MAQRPCTDSARRRRKARREAGTDQVIRSRIKLDENERMSRDRASEVGVMDGRIVACLDEMRVV